MSTRFGWPMDHTSSWVKGVQRKIEESERVRLLTTQDDFKEYLGYIRARHEGVHKALTDPEMDLERTQMLRGYLLALREILDLSKGLEARIQGMQQDLQEAAEQADDDAPEFVPVNPHGRES